MNARTILLVCIGIQALMTPWPWFLHHLWTFGLVLFLIQDDNDTDAHA